MKDDFHSKNRLSQRRFAISLFFKLILKDACLAEKYRKMHFLAKYGHNISVSKKTEVKCIYIYIYIYIK